MVINSFNHDRQRIDKDLYTNDVVVCRLEID